MHHLARHSVACFLTRGDLYISWERGRWGTGRSASIHLFTLWPCCSSRPSLWKDLLRPPRARRDVFDKYLIDADWSLNNANWMWLSASSFFYQFMRVYSPISFGKKYDPNGNFIRHFLPGRSREIDSLGVHL